MDTKKKKGTPPPRYDEAFKSGAVRMVTEQGRQPAEVAKELRKNHEKMAYRIKSTVRHFASNPPEKTMLTHWFTHLLPTY